MVQPASTASTGTQAQRGEIAMKLVLIACLPGLLRRATHNRNFTAGVQGIFEKRREEAALAENNYEECCAETGLTDSYQYGDEKDPGHAAPGGDRLGLKRLHSSNSLSEEVMGAH
jgi:hypothetical protein